ncbi:MAG: integrin alpha, partial [Pseudomonadota bacterium]
TNIPDLSNLLPAQGFMIQDDADSDRAGWSVSSAGDVNGDGFDDLMVGAPYNDAGGNQAGAAYVIYGGKTGTESTVPITRTGTADPNNFTGNAGDDTFENIDVNDVVRGGAGDDRIEIDTLTFADIDGGHGSDTLVFNGTGLVLDMTTYTQRIDRIETIDLTGSGANSLTLDKLSLLDLSEATAVGVTTLTVRGDAGDTVTLSDTGWAANGTETDGGVTYNVYENYDANGHGARLLVQEDVAVTLPSLPVSATSNSQTVNLTQPDTFDLDPVPDTAQTRSEFADRDAALTSFFQPPSLGDADPSLSRDLEAASDTWLNDEMRLTVDLLHLNDAALVTDMGG